MPEDSFEHLEKIRDLEQAGKYVEADRWFQQNLQGESRPDSYQYVGWLDVHYEGVAALTSTHRSLDLKTGTAKSVHTLADGSTLTQAVFAVGSDDVIVVRFTADQPFGLSISMDGAKPEQGDLVKSAAASGEGATRYVSRVRTVAAEKIQSKEKALVVRGTREVTLYLSVATDFDRTDSSAKLSSGWEDRARMDLDAVSGAAPLAIHERAVAEHQAYFDRMSVDLGQTDAAILALPTKKRLQRIKVGKHDDPDLIETYFQFGRYLLIASSRPGAFPANLQGVWNPHESAPWGSDYHLNINLQMNYWLAETCNLAEMHQPLFDLIRYFQPNGKEMARRLGMKGWCMGHSTDIWGHEKQ